MNNGVARSPEPSQANSPSVRSIRRSQTPSAAPGITPLSLPDHSSPWRQSTASRSFDNELKRGLGSFVVDFRRYPPLDALPPPVNFPMGSFVHNLSGRIAFKSSEHQDDGTQKRSKLKFYRFSRPQQTKSQVAIEAEASFEHLLEHSEVYVSNVFYNERRYREWLVRKEEQKQGCYVVVGYITYLDARVSEDGANENQNPNMAAAVTIEPGASSSSFNSRKTGKQRFECPDYLTRVDTGQSMSLRKRARTFRLSMCEK